MYKKYKGVSYRHLKRGLWVIYGECSGGISLEAVAYVSSEEQVKRWINVTPKEEA